MGFFSSLWEGAKNVASKAWDAVCAVADFLFETAFWLVGIIFSAIEAFFEWIDDMIDSIIDTIGNFFSGGDSEGGVLPPTPEVIQVVEKYDKEYGTTYSRKVREGKGSLGYVTDSQGKICGSKIVGSDKGFDTTIAAAHKRKRIYASKITD